MCFPTSFYESPDGEFISAGKCFDKGEGEEEKTLLFRILGGVFICFGRNFKKWERKTKKNVINQNTRQHGFTLLSILRLKKRGTLRHSSVSASLSQHIRVFSNLVFYESPDGKFISAGKCFNKGKREEEKTLLFRILYGVFIRFDRNFKWVARVKTEKFKHCSSDFSLPTRKFKHPI